MRRYWKFWPAVIVRLLVNWFPNKLGPNVPNKIPRRPHFCSFRSFWTVSLTPFINKADSSRHLTIFIISFISSFQIVVTPDPNIFSWIAASVADAAAVNPNMIERF